MSGYAEPDYAGFWQVVMNSPSLQSRAREFVQELEDLIATLLAEADKADPAGFRVRFTAAAVYRTVFLTGARRIMAGAAHQQVSRALADLYAEGFDAVERALTGLPRD
jgi:hypothetical protein